MPIYQLFKLSKTGKVLSFNIALSDFDHPQKAPVIHTTKGFFDGAKQVDSKMFTEGKNLGRANETSPMEQALSEALSQKNKLLDKGYKEWPCKIIPPEFELRSWLIEQGVGTDASGKLKPMLAHKNIEPITFPCYGDYKYDGVRCFTFIEDGEIEKVSRNGKPFPYLSHLDGDLDAFLGDGNWIVDGELYSHTMSFQSIISSVKREQPSNKEIGYRIYDLIPMDNLKVPQWERILKLKSLRKMAKTYPGELHLDFVPHFRIEDMDDVKEFFSKAIAKGYEGAIFRNEDAIYNFGHRSRGLMKYKEFLEEEFEIVGAEEATGRDRGSGIMVLKTESGKVFRARPLGTYSERRDYLLNIKQYLGKRGTVKFQEYTDEGIPRFPIFKAIRDYEG